MRMTKDIGRKTRQDISGLVKVGNQRWGGGGGAPVVSQANLWDL